MQEMTQTERRGTAWAAKKWNRSLRDDGDVPLTTPQSYVPLKRGGRSFRSPAMTNPFDDLIKSFDGVPGAESTAPSPKGKPDMFIKSLDLKGKTLSDLQAAVSEAVQAAYNDDGGSPLPTMAVRKFAWPESIEDDRVIVSVGGRGGKTQYVEIPWTWDGEKVKLAIDKAVEMEEVPRTWKRKKKGADVEKSESGSHFRPEDVFRGEVGARVEADVVKAQGPVGPIYIDRSFDRRCVKMIEDGLIPETWQLGSRVSFGR